MNDVYAVVDLRTKPTIVGRFQTLVEACARLRRLPESASYDVFRLYAGGICQLERSEVDYVRSARRPVRYDDKGQEA